MFICVSTVKGMVALTLLKKGMVALTLFNLQKNLVASTMLQTATQAEIFSL